MNKIIEAILAFFKPKATIDEYKFFQAVKPLFPTLKQSQLEGVQVLLKAVGKLPVPYQAYLLATSYHETAKTMQPITEYGGKSYFNKYDSGSLAKALGNTQALDGDGYLYRGRGFVQLTGKANYLRASKELGKDFLNNPDLALETDIAATILVVGCTEGWFTGKKLGDYLNGEVPNYKEARRVVNGLDDATLIASYAVTFENAINLSS